MRASNALVERRDVSCFLDHRPPQPPTSRHRGKALALSSATFAAVSPAILPTVRS